MSETLTNRAYIWGAGKYGERALKYCKDQFDIVGFVDKRADSEFNEFCSRPVITPSEFLSSKQEINVIIAITFPAEVMKLLNENIYAHVYIFDGRNPENYILYKVENSEICCPEYMDKEYIEWKPYSEHYSKQTKYILNIFMTALKSIKQQKEPVKIIEIGCGSGLFANMLFDNGYSDYVGIDFSPEAIRLAKKANIQHTEKFICCDAFEYLSNYSGKDNTVFVIFEVLEHINRDIELLNMLPSKSRIIFSVPNFKSFNHIRVFNDLQEIKERYTMLNIHTYHELPSQTEGKVYHFVVAEKSDNAI